MSQILVSWAALALAQPAPAPASPVSTQATTAHESDVAHVGLAAMLLGGVDRWDGGGGATTELRLGFSGRRALGSVLVDGWLTSSAQAWQGPLTLDHHEARGAWTGHHGLGGEVLASGSASQGWAEALAGPRVRAAGAWGEVSLRLGPVGRLWSDDGALAGSPGLAARARGRWRLGRRVGADASLMARAWSGSIAPWGTASLGVAWSPTLDMTLGARVVDTTTPRGDLLPVAGALGSGTSIARAQLELGWWPTADVALTIEAGPELAFGSLDYTRFRALAGLTVTSSRSRERQSPPGRTRLIVQAPGATRVAVIGDFTGWVAVPLERSGDAWWIELDIPSGTHAYVYLVDGDVLVPPEATEQRSDGFGGTNGVLIIPP